MRLHVTPEWQDVSAGFRTVSIAARDHTGPSGIDVRKRVTAGRPAAADDGEPFTLSGAARLVPVGIGKRLWLKANNQFDAVVGLSNELIVDPPVPVPTITTDDLSTKSPYLDWQDTPVLWLGTSIPNQGNPIDSYPDLVISRLGGSIVNTSFSSSHVRYDIAENPPTDNGLRALSMTMDDVAWGLATYGPTSPYAFHDNQTCDACIDAYYAAAAAAGAPFRVVVLDHAHNDRDPAFYGTASFEAKSITAVVKGVTTQVTLSSIGTIVVGNGVVLNPLNGIANLNHAAARVQAVAGNVITLNIDSSGYAGTFASGTCTKYDRATVHGATRFIYHRIRRAAFLAGVTDPVIIFNGAPSDYTGNHYDATIRSVAEVMKSIADGFDCAFFDFATRLGMSLDYQMTYFEDGIHPETSAQREVLANVWGEWLAGGATRNLDPTTFVPAPAHDPGDNPVYIDQAPLVYSRFLGGAGTPGVVIGEPITVFTDDFSAGIGTWTSVGTAPTFGAAPWGSGSSIHCVTNSGTGTPNSYLSRSISLDRGRVVEFDLWFPAVTGLAPGLKKVTICQLRSTGGYYIFDIHTDGVATTFYVSYFQKPNNTQIILAIPTTPLQASRKYRVRFEMYAGTSVDDPGRLLFYLDNVLFAGPLSLNDWEQTAVALLYFGLINSNTGQALTADFGNLTVSNLPTEDTGGAASLPTTSGTWTPVFSFFVPGDSVITHTVQVGKYVRIGSLVLLMLDIEFNTNAFTTASGVAQIAGLPFTGSFSLEGTLTLGLNNVTFTTAQLLRLAVPISGTMLFLRIMTSNAAATNAGITQIPASKTGVRIRASGMYWTDAA